MVKKKNKKPKLTKEQLAEKKKRDAFSKQIENIFVLSGFTKLSVKGWQFLLGGKQNELDHCFIYENIIIICEDTIRFVKEKEQALAAGMPFNKNHKLEKEETSKIIRETEKASFIKLLRDKFPSEETLQRYTQQEFNIYYLYFEYGITRYIKEDIERYTHLNLIDKSTFSYFCLMSKSIKASFKYELFKYLKLRIQDIGKPDPSGNSVNLPIVTPIIYPDSVTGYKDGIRMVSFMMKPIDLIKYSYVLRKDGWEKQPDMYQRLLTVKRIKSIRDFVIAKKTTFINNIIVTLPDGVRFFNKDNRETVILDNVVRFDNNIMMEIPTEYNSIGIIDGQHRVFAFYEDCDKDNTDEQLIKPMRDSYNLLVTGIIYPDNEKYKHLSERRRFESELFVSINKNAKPVDADTLIQIQAIMNPTSGEAVSRRVIELLNNDAPFENMFQLSKTDDAPIKIASIIQYAMSSLLVAKNVPTSLYKYWLKKNNYSNDFVLEQSKDIEDYIKYCANSLRTYFKAIKGRFLNYWDKNSRLLKVISLNAFIIAFKETLANTQGPKNYDFYLNAFRDFNLDFSSDNTNFPYAGAQYSKFAKALIIPAINKQNRDSL